MLLASYPWGPVTANGVDLMTEIYVIYMEMHTSHRATVRCFGSGTFTNFGTLPSTLATCQYWETHLEEVSCRSLTFGNLHAANSTPPDPLWFWIAPHIAPVTKNGPERAYFHRYLTLTFDLWPQKPKNRQAAIRTHVSAKNGASRSNGLNAEDVH